MDLYNLVVSAKITKGEGGDVSVDALNVTENGTYTAQTGHAYNPVTVNVPQSGITPSGTSNITSNGVYDVTNFASASVSVPVGVFPSGTSSITANGIYDITNFASVDVNVAGGGGGGITADDIAMRTISGVVSGSATSISPYTFSGCSNITGANFPNATVIGSSAFLNCISLSTANFPNAVSISVNAFAYCSSLTTISLPNVTSFGNSAFRDCRQLMSVYFLGSSVPNYGTNPFGNTPMLLSTYTGSFGSIFVPASLVDSYKSKWSIYSSRITAYVE